MSASWQQRHTAAMTSPRFGEVALVSLLDAIHELSVRYANDNVLRDGVAQLILGTRTLLVADWGDRLDMGLIDALLVIHATRLRFCLDHERFEDGCAS